MNLEQQNVVVRKLPKFRVNLNPRLVAILASLLLFSLTIFFIEPITEWYLDRFYLKPGVIETMGLNPKFETFQGSLLQRKALKDPALFPLYGSSEMSMIFDYHPGKVFAGRPTGFQPYLVGKGGTQTIIQALNLAALGDDLKGKKVAVFVTPQWYSPLGIQQSTFGGNFSPLHAYEIMLDSKLSASVKQRIAFRILQFPDAVKDYPLLKALLVANASSNREAKLQRKLYYFPAKIELSALQINDLSKSIYYLKKLPKKISQATNQASSSRLNKGIDWTDLRSKAIEEASEVTSKNRFGMLDSFYFEHIEPKLEERKGSDKKAKLFPSPEYEDLQILLDILGEKNAKPIVVIIPMNGPWYDYTEFPRSERTQCYELLANIVRSHGFALADLSSHEYDKYYLRDPWHLAWEGWVDVDQALDEFYHNN
ncbi:MAG: D-alanyl-lipoteichoic acid biosynthesis protein DltD [Desulfitobacterium hafniense]|nr:D-alanyl-lipoteichoic acid biosynthesis protein DltD [Desulfitobacterium hafniense]